MGSKKGRTSGRSARPVAASYRDKASSSPSLLSSFSRDCLGGRLLEGKPVEALLASTLFQLLPLLGLADLALLGGVLRLLLLGRQEA
jgi:hypothetical protein